jgi:alanyl-tRNA synthetase
MDPAEYDLAFFHHEGFRRKKCPGCGQAFWTLGDLDRCQEDPCTPYGFLGHSPLKRSYQTSEMRETYLSFFEKRGHPRIRRYPVVARWRNDVFFTQASIYDFQPWVTSGAIPPPANPLTISQPCTRFNDLSEVGRSGRHFSLFEMMAHHAFNRPDHEVYFKERCTALCHELVTQELGADPQALTYKEEEWEGGGNLGPSLSVGISGLEIATLVFMEYVRDGAAIKPMPGTVVDTGYGLERFTWLSQGTRTAYEAVFGEPYEELRRTFPAAESAILVDHARTVNFLITDGVVPSNSQEGYFARLLLRRMLRVLAKTPEAPDLVAVLDRVGREVARDYPEVGANRADLHRVVEAEETRYAESIARARGLIRRAEDRAQQSGRRITETDLVEWYDSLGVPPDVAVEELRQPPAIPEDFYARVAALHETERPVNEYTETAATVPELTSSAPPTEALYYLDPYTLSFAAHIVWTEGSLVVLDRTYFYPTGGGQITDTGSLSDIPVEEVIRRGPWIFHRLDRPSPWHAGERVHGRIDPPRRIQLMQHHTATHLLNGALRELLGPHVWQAGAYKSVEGARIDITHFQALSPAELRRVERRVNEIVRENRPVKSYFESRTEAERRFGFTLYQGGAVPGKELRIVEIEQFDVEACGGTHCTHTSEVGGIAILSTDRIQDGIVRVSFAAGERALELHEEHETILHDAAKRLGVSVEKIPETIDRLLAQRDEDRRLRRGELKEDLSAIASRLLADSKATVRVGVAQIVTALLGLDRTALMGLSRILTREPERVAILGAERESRGTLFIGSSSADVSARALLEQVKETFGGKGGGDSSAATAVGEPGAALKAALAEATDCARRQLVGDSG